MTAHCLRVTARDAAYRRGYQVAAISRRDLVPRNLIPDNRDDNSSAKQDENDQGDDGYFFEHART
ncbi:hypothetical protein HK24_13490 [Gluconobacter sp. DsW_058]|nr:hypothetical protein HK24_13490 [Gluconobacter sp. DsW_058]